MRNIIIIIFFLLHFSKNFSQTRLEGYFVTELKMVHKEDTSYSVYKSFFVEESDCKNFKQKSYYFKINKYDSISDEKFIHIDSQLNNFKEVEFPKYGLLKKHLKIDSSDITQQHCFYDSLLVYKGNDEEKIYVIEKIRIDSFFVFNVDRTILSSKRRILVFKSKSIVETNTFFYKLMGLRRCYLSKLNIF